MKELKQQIAKLRTEIKELDASRKYFKQQSEWHRMMYALVLKLEILESLSGE